MRLKRRRALREGVKGRRNAPMVARSALGAVVTVVTVVSLPPWPPSARGSEAAGPAINVTRGQWQRETGKENMPQAKQVTVFARTADITCGFDVVDEEGLVLFQARLASSFVAPVVLAAGLFPRRHARRADWSSG